MNVVAAYVIMQEKHFLMHVFHFPFSNCLLKIWGKGSSSELGGGVVNYIWGMLHAT